MPPLLSPQDLFAVTVRDYAEQRRRRGLPVDMAEIRKQAFLDLSLVDRAASNGELVGPGKQRHRGLRRAIPGDESEPVKAAIAGAAAPGGETMRTFDRTQNRTVEHRRGEIYTSKLLDANPLLTDETWSRAIARLKRIMSEGRAAIANPTLQTNSKVTQLAKEWVEMQAYFFTRCKNPPLTGVDHNPFRHLNDEDADRLLRRKVEDICDRSTGVFGSWRTPK
jgi:hypothetical protein